MTTTFPVHPDDVAMLMKIRRYLVGYRVCNDWSQPDLSMRINGTKGAAYDLEHSTRWAWRFSKLQAWAAAFDLRIKVRLIFDHDFGLEQRVEEHPEVAPFLALARTTEPWQKWQRIALTSMMKVARTEQGMNTTELAERLGVTRKAVSDWEALSDEVLLSGVLHRARALGGRLHIELEGI